MSCLQGRELAGSMVIHRLPDANDVAHTGVNVPVRGRFVGLPGSVAALPHAELVHDVGLAAQAGLAGRKCAEGVGVFPRKQPNNVGVDGLGLVYRERC